ncbi:MAG: zf-HC2 domain-containing protein [Thioalkalispiraceae bacterium]|jgi:anti-sigma factor RsiW
MNCAEAQNLLDAYLDQQLDAANSLRIEQHLKGCMYCAREFQEMQNLKQLIQDNIEPYSAPDELQINILNKLTDTQKIESDTNCHQHKILKYGLSFAASLLIAFFLGLSFYQHNQEERLVNDILAEHTRAINANRYADISSSQADTIISWFTNKLNYSPRVFNFSDYGFKLTGGRLDSVQDQNIATVSYQIDHSLINVYTWPSPDIDDAVQESHDKHGYNILYWCQNNMNYWIISNTDSQHVKKLAELIKHKLDEHAIKVQETDP